MAGSNLLTLQPGEDNVLLSKTSQTIWFWISLTFAALWLMTLVLWWRNRRPSTSQPKESVSQLNIENTKKAKKQFLSACRKNDPKLARQTLLQWAAIHWPQSPPTGLDALALRLNNVNARTALNDLDCALYQDKDVSWEGNKLARAINQFPVRVHESDEKAVVPSLYARG